MRNHGVAVVGASIEESTILALTLETACRIQLLAMAGGGVGELFAPELVQRLHRDMNTAEQYVINFEYLRRKLRLVPR
jgi:L-fuculose-phosphate aldolase